jgi:glycosyltransferase involved in cell wall biosynthesis
MMPLQAAYTYQPNLIHAVNDLISNQPFDVVHVEHVRGAHYAAHIDSLPKVYDSVDCITLLLRQFLGAKKNPFSWLLALEEWAKMRVYEAMLSERFERVVITSPRDRKTLEDLLWQRIRKRIKIKQFPVRMPETLDELDEWRLTKQLIEMSQDQRLASLMPQGGHVSVLPNGVDHEYFSPMDVSEEPDSLVFTGKMSYAANTAAAEYLCRDILPLVRARYPKVKVTLAGADPPPKVRKLAEDPSVTITDYVDDLRPYIARAAVAVCPITIGAGIQNKVLEAMAMGKPVVATSRGCAALDVENGRELLVSDQPEQIAADIIKLLSSSSLRQEIGHRAAEYVRQKHDWEVISKRLIAIYEEAADVFRAATTQPL